MGGKPLDNRRKSASFWIKCALLVSALCLVLYFREDIASLNLRDLVAQSGNRWIAGLTVQLLFVVKTLLPFIPANALCLACAMAVSYTHLDVYKRQARYRLSARESSSMTARLTTPSAMSTL